MNNLIFFLLIKNIFILSFLINVFSSLISIYLVFIALLVLFNRVFIANKKKVKGCALGHKGTVNGPCTSLLGLGVYYSWSPKIHQLTQ